MPAQIIGMLQVPSAGGTSASSAPNSRPRLSPTSVLEARQLYAAYAVPASGKPLFQGASANLNPRTEAKVDTRNPKDGGGPTSTAVPVLVEHRRGGVDSQPRLRLGVARQTPTPTRRLARIKQRRPTGKRCLKRHSPRAVRAADGAG